MLRRQFHFAVAIVGLLMFICAQEVFSADFQTQGSPGVIVMEVEDPSASVALALLQLLDETEADSIAQVEEINSGRFNPFLAGRSSRLP